MKFQSGKTFLKWYEREAETENGRPPINKVKPPIIPPEPLDPVSIDTIKSQTLRRYMKKREDHNPALWVTKFGELLSETGLRRMLLRRAAQAGVLVPSVHDFRRVFELNAGRRAFIS